MPEILWWSVLHLCLFKAVDGNLVDGNPLWRSFPGRDSDQFEFVKSCQVFGGAVIGEMSRGGEMVRTGDEEGTGKSLQQICGAS